MGNTQDPGVDALHRINSRWIRHFLMVADCQSFTAAAVKLHLTQPALSRSIQNLEERLEVRLIERDSKSFQLTKFGQLVVDKARVIRQEFEQVLSEVQALKEGHAGTVSIGVGYSSAPLLTPAISAFQTLRPNITVRILVSSMEANYQGLLDGKLDIICTGVNFTQNSNLVTQKIGKTRNIIIARNDHPLANGKTVEPAQLLEYPWIFFTDDRMGYQRVGGYFAANQLEPPRAAIETNTIEEMIDLLNQGNYIASAPAILPTYIQQSRGSVSEIPISGSFWDVEIGIVYQRFVQLSPAAASLASALKSHLKTTLSN